MMLYFAIPPKNFNRFQTWFSDLFLGFSEILVGRGFPALHLTPCVGRRSVPAERRGGERLAIVEADPLGNRWPRSNGRVAAIRSRR